jgi:ribosome modulation factor
MATQKRIEQAHAQGVEANENGERFDANPYTSNDQLAMAWSQGWVEMQQVREEWEQSNHDRARMWA